MAGEAIMVAVPSARGPIRCAYHAVPGATAAVVMVGGGDGGLDGPAEALYPTLADDLATVGIATLRLDFRVHGFPGDLEQAAYDVLHGIGELNLRGHDRIGLLGHSFGGAVVIAAGVRAPASVRAVATLATQTAGAQRVAELAPCPLLLVHGLADVRLPPECSRYLFEQADEPKRLELLEGATHSLRQRREEVRALVRDWFTRTLGAAT